MKLEQISVRLDTATKEELQQYCQENETTIAQLVRKLIKDFLRKE